MNSSANQISPISHRRDAPSRVANFSNRQVLLDVLEFVLDRPPPPGRNMPSTGRVTQGGKLGISGREHQPVSAISRMAHAVGKARSAGLAGRVLSFVQVIRKAVINAVSMQSWGFIKNFRLRSMVGCFALKSDCSLGICSLGN
jgi:hypothetical protein